jgi:hypothetical protein
LSMVRRACLGIYAAAMVISFLCGSAVAISGAAVDAVATQQHVVAGENGLRMGDNPLEPARIA